MKKREFLGGAMLISDLIKQLESLPDEVKNVLGGRFTYSMPLWQVAQFETSDVKLNTLNFELAGKVIRFLVTTLKKPPTSNYISDYIYGRDYTYRKCVWIVKSPKMAYLAEKATIQLNKLGIHDFGVCNGWFVIHIPKECYVSSFLKSDNLEDWRKAQAKTENRIAKMKAVKAVIEALDEKSVNNDKKRRL